MTYRELIEAELRRNASLPAEDEEVLSDAIHDVTCASDRIYSLRTILRCLMRAGKAKSSPKDFAVRICRNSWAWGLEEYCRRTGLDPGHDYAKEKFRNFQKLAKLLADLDQDTLNVIAAE